jgi:hypothetical protein
VKLVEDHHPDTFQQRVVLYAASQDALGDHLDPGGRRYTALEADRIAHRLTGLFPQGERHPAGNRRRGDAAGHQHDDAARFGWDNIQQCQGHAGGLAGAGRGVQNGIGMISDGAEEVGEDCINRKRVHSVGSPIMVCADKYIFAHIDTSLQTQVGSGKEALHGLFHENNELVSLTAPSCPDYM